MGTNTETCPVCGQPGTVADCILDLMARVEVAEARRSEAVDGSPTDRHAGPAWVEQR